MTVPPVDLDDLKDELNMSLDPSPDDPELTAKLEGATDACEGEVGPMLHRSVTERVTVYGCVLVVTSTPLVSVETLTGVDGTTYIAGDLDPDRSGVVRGDFDRGRYDVVYTAGHGATAAEIPEAMKQAVLIVAAHMWETQRGRQARAGFIPGEGTTPTDQGTLIMRGFSLPRRALELLKPYRLAPAVA